MNIHEKYINRCIQIAENGLGTTYSNPLVGSVLVIDDEIIGGGWHRKAGEPHAEVLAINSVNDDELLKKATIYVNLEPCSHYGKTPPCSDLIIAKGIKKVVIGTVDPHSKVAGKGIKKLLDAGCEVLVGILEEKCNDLNKRFFTFHEKKRPYIILKWAQTQDHFIAPVIKNSRDPVWISNSLSQQLVHKWRAEEQAIMVGTNTAIADNPSLTSRKWQGQNPIRIVLDRNLQIPLESHIFDDAAQTIVFHGKKENPEKPNFYSLDFSENLPQQICEKLYERNIQSLIIEGGLATLQSFIDTHFWDEARIFTGKTFFEEGISAPKIKGKPICMQNIDGDLLTILKND